MTAICRTCRGFGDYKSGCHTIACPECNGTGEVEAQACSECGLALGQAGFECPEQGTFFCSEQCFNYHDESVYAGEEEDYYSGEREVDSYPYD